MVLEQATGSVIAFLLNAAQSAMPETEITPYVHCKVPEGWKTPSVHFPVPEIEHVPRTLTAFGRRYIMYVLWFGNTISEAYAMANAADLRVHAARDAIPLLAEDGSRTGRYVSMLPDGQRVSVVDAEACAVQLAVIWVRSVNYDAPEIDRMLNFELNMHVKH